MDVLSAEMIEELRARAHDPGRALDEGFVYEPVTFQEPLSEDELDKVERLIGVTLPRGVREIYGAVANGGFGPGYGLIGLSGGARDDLERDVVASYAINREPDPDDPGWSWPEGLLGVCHWGCAILSCVDCRTGDDPQIIRFDPNPVDSDWSMAFFPEGKTLARWLRGWLDGEDLWEGGFVNSPFAT